MSEINHRLAIVILGATLGKGGFAKVFLAHETDHYTAKKRSIAIKVYRSHWLIIK